MSEPSLRADPPSTTPLFLALVDIPSGYRVHEFRVLASVLRERGIDFRAVFMSKGQRGRLWEVHPESFGFTHRFARGPAVYPGEHLPVHVTPGAWLDAVRLRPDWLLLGGSWYQPAVFAASVANRARHVLAWSESWVVSSGRAAPLRGGFFRRVDGSVVPGSRAGDYVRAHADHPVLHLANTVDESVFRDLVDEHRRRRDAVRASFGFDEDAVVFAWPARLDPAKGITPFLDAIDGIPGNFVIALAGVGSQRAEVVRRAERDPRLRVLGHLFPDDLVRLYASADVLLLPSLFEPFGFVTVEALWAGLPLLLSDRVGAAPEVLEEAGNGWLVDPEDPTSVREGFLAALDRGTHSAMGERSRALAESRFASRPAAERFVDALLTGFPPGGEPR